MKPTWIILLVYLIQELNGHNHTTGHSHSSSKEDNVKEDNDLEQKIKSSEIISSDEIRLPRPVPLPNFDVNGQLEISLNPLWPGQESEGVRDVSDINGGKPAHYNIQHPEGNSTNLGENGKNRGGNDKNSTGDGKNRGGNVNHPTGDGKNQGGNVNNPTGDGKNRGGNVNNPKGKGKNPRGNWKNPRGNAKKRGRKWKKIRGKVKAPGSKKTHSIYSSYTGSSSYEVPVFPRPFPGNRQTIIIIPPSLLPNGRITLSNKRQENSKNVQHTNDAELARFLSEVKAGSQADIFGSNPHIKQSSKYYDLARRFVPQYSYIEAKKEDDIVPKLAPPEVVLAVARESALIESSKPANPSNDVIHKDIMRTGNYWNAVWREEGDPEAALRSVKQKKKPLGSVQAQIMPGSKLHDLVSKLKQISPRLLYVINIKDKKQNDI